MKQIKTIMAAFLILVAASSCKKDIEVIIPPTADVTGPKLSAIKYEGSNYVQTFTYNTSGRLVNIKDNYFTMKFTYPSSSFGYEVFKGDTLRQSDLANIIVTNNKVTGYDYLFYYNAGSFNSTPTTLQYDANDYQVAKSYSGYEYVYTINNSNTVNMKQTNTANGTIRNTVLEYYTDKPNKLNINLMENWYLDQIFCDQQLMGKQSKNLPKKISYTSTTYNSTTELSYEMNADGLPAQMVISYSENGGAPKITTANLTYQ